MRFNLNQPIPILFLGDGPDSPTGLGRIGHDLAYLVCSMPEFRVGYLGRMAFGRSRFPWTQYSFGVTEQWGEQRIQEAWEDLAKGQRGIVFTVWDASRLLWFADGRETNLEAWLKSKQFERWGYFMLDSSGPNPAALPQAQAHTVSQYERVLVASRWGYSLVESLPLADGDWMPHPINREVYRPLGRAARSLWNVGDSEVLLGCVMANQQRKQWPVVFDAVARLSMKLNKSVRLWFHTDKLVHYWDLVALAVEYGIAGQLITDNRALRDGELAQRYSACDATLVVSGAEGFCYPVAESLSCGVPAVSGDYGAQADLTPWRVPHAATYIDTQHNVRRAVYDAEQVADTVAAVLAERISPESCVAHVEHLNMKELGIQWKKWFKRGLQ